MTPKPRPFDLAAAIEHGWPKRPQQNHVNENGEALDPGNPFKVIGQKLHYQKQQKNRTDDERDPGNCHQEEAEATFAYVAWPGHKLHKNIARQLPPQTLSRLGRIAKLRVQLFVIHADLRRQHDEMQKRIGMGDNEQNRRQKEKGDERQFNIKERQFDRGLQQKILMGDGARRLPT
jgi:hypothetical protein